MVCTRWPRRNKKAATADRNQGKRIQADSDKAAASSQRWLEKDGERSERVNDGGRPRGYATMHRPRNRAPKRLYGNYTREIGEIWSREMRCGHPSLSRPTCPRLPSKPAAWLPDCLPAWLAGFVASLLRCFDPLLFSSFLFIRIICLPSPLPALVQVVLPLLRDSTWMKIARRVFRWLW